MDVAADLKLALALAELGDRVALDCRSRRAHVRTKADGSPVSDADVEVERAIVDRLASERPDDAVLSEECGSCGGCGPRRWLLDPIDGTTRYLAGGRDWGVHVALEIAGRVAAGVITRPTEGRRWWAAEGLGAFTGGSHAPRRRLRVSTTTRLVDARVGGLVDPRSLAAETLAGGACWVDDSVSIMAAFLDGRVDAVLDEGGEAWDRAPAMLLTVEAGGRWHTNDPRNPFEARWVVYTGPGLDREPLAKAMTAVDSRPTGAPAPADGRAAAVTRRPA